MEHFILIRALGLLQLSALAGCVFPIVNKFE